LFRFRLSSVLEYDTQRDIPQLKFLLYVVMEKRRFSFLYNQ
jgi:hypothetical protein